MTQGKVAEEMTERGHSFSQQTVAKIETGSRRVSVGEAAELADIIGRDLALLIGDQLDQEGALINAVFEKQNGLKRAIHDYVVVLFRLAAWMERTPPKGSTAAMAQQLFTHPALLLRSFASSAAESVRGNFTSDGSVWWGPIQSALFDSLYVAPTRLPDGESPLVAADRDED